jgi:hypothetical protein
MVQLMNKYCVSTFICLIAAFIFACYTAPREKEIPISGTLCTLHHWGMMETKTCIAVPDRKSIPAIAEMADTAGCSGITDGTILILNCEMII